MLLLPPACAPPFLGLYLPRAGRAWDVSTSAFPGRWWRPRGHQRKCGWWQQSLQMPPPLYKIAQTCFFSFTPSSVFIRRMFSEEMPSINTEKLLAQTQERGEGAGAAIVTGGLGPQEALQAHGRPLLAERGTQDPKLQ